MTGGDALPQGALETAAFARLEDAGFWPRSWVCVGAGSEIRNRGDLLPYTVGVHGIHVQRTADGGVVGRFNKAQHGGCHFIPIQCQTGQKTRCGFTSCGYSLDRPAILADPRGQPVPAMYQYLGQRPERLGPVRALETGGLLFVALDPHEPGGPPAPPGLPGRVVACGWRTVAANWKLVAAALARAEGAVWQPANLVLLPDGDTCGAAVLQPVAPRRTICRTLLGGEGPVAAGMQARWQERLARLAAAAETIQAEAGGPPGASDALHWPVWLHEQLAELREPDERRSRYTAYPINARYGFVA